MRSWTGLVTEIWVFATKILVIKIKNFLFEHSSLGDCVKPFFVNEIALFLLHSGQKCIIVLLCIFTSDVCYDNEKVMRVQKVTTLTNDTSLCSIILVLFLELISTCNWAQYG